MLLSRRNSTAGSSDNLPKLLRKKAMYPEDDKALAMMQQLPN